MVFKTKALLIVILFSLSSRAWAFDQLVCEGDLDVRLNPGGKKAAAKTFTITQKEALELEISVAGTKVGQIFPWDHVVWQPAKPSPAFRDVKFKTDDSTVIDFSVVTSKDKKTHELHCSFRLS